MDEELNLDEMFDFNPIIIPEIYAFHLLSNEPESEYSPVDDLKQQQQQQQLMTWKYPNNYNINSQQLETIITTNNLPSSSSSSSQKLISFQNHCSNNTSSSYDHHHQLPPPNADILNNNINNVISSQIISFSSKPSEDGRVLLRQKRDSGLVATRTPEQAREHLMAERKHRHNLRQLFITLSKLVPGLKKLDKASLLEDATNYLKALQERINILEEQDIKKSSIIKQEYSSSSCKETTSFDGTSTRNKSTSELAVPAEIKARILDNHVLIKIFCKKETGLMSRIPIEMGKMHISVVDMRMMPFGGEALDITVLAETQSEFRGTVKDIVDQLQRVFFNNTT